MKVSIFSAILAALLGYAAADCTAYPEDSCVGEEGPVFIPSTESCQGWIQCSNHEMFRCGTCADGLYFDPVQRGCTHSGLVDCDMSTSRLCTPGLINRVARADSCSVYYQCTGEGAPIEHSCGEGLHFNSATEKCDFINNVRCLREPVRIECPATNEPFTQEPHPFVCNRFFMCINGVDTERTCLEGMHFDIVLRQCQVATNAQCILDVEEKRSAPFLEQKEVAVSGSTLSDSFQCSKEPSYYKARFPENCQWYVQCISGEANIMSCVNGTLFDQNTMRCEIADKVTC